MRKARARTGGQLTFSAGEVRKLLDHASDGGRDAGNPHALSLLLVTDSDGVYLASNGPAGQIQKDEDIRFAFADGFRPGLWEDKFAMARHIAKVVGEEPQVVSIEASAFELVLGKANDWDVLTLGVTHDGSRLSRVLVMPAKHAKEINTGNLAPAGTSKAEIESLLGQI